MNVSCTASGATGYERVTATDVEAIRSLRDVGELKEFMRRWGEKNL
jgi:hypothetical protein